MAKIKDWTIQVSGSKDIIYTAENSSNHLIRHENSDLAEIKQGGENIIITVNGTLIVIDDNKKSISISQRQRT